MMNIHWRRAGPTCVVGHQAHEAQDRQPRPAGLAERVRQRQQAHAQQNVEHIADRLQRRAHRRWDIAADSGLPSRRRLTCPMQQVYCNMQGVCNDTMYVCVCMCVSAFNIKE